MESTRENQSVFTPRAYQIDLYEKAVKNNTILYLPTGAGKTYIAVMLLKHLSGDVRKSYQEGGKRSIFAVNTVPLVLQHADYISRHTDLKCKGYSGDMNVDFWEEQQWLQEIEEHEVLVMTSQIFLNLLTHGYMKLDRVNLIVFDECHRAVSNHPMRQIMQQFESCPKEKQPRILAMSATLLNANIKMDKIESTIRSLEITFHAKIATVESTDCIQEYCTNPRESIIKYTNYVVPKIIEKITYIVKRSIEPLKQIKLTLDEIYYESSEKMRPKTKSSKLIAILNDIQMTTSQAGIYGGSKSALLHLIQLESLRKYSNDRMTDVLLDYLITQVTLIRKLLDNEMKDYTELERLYKFSSYQIHKLFEILLDNSKLNKQKFCCIIFVKERFMTQVIYHMLKTLSTHKEEYSFLSPDYVLGFQNNPYKNSREVSCIAKWNKDVLQRFKRGLINCIVATDVVDEGIDIPTCTLIIRYDEPMDFRGYVQSKGRARHSSSNYIILIPEDDNKKFLPRYCEYKNTESKLKKILVGQSEQRTLPTQNDIVNDLYSDFEIKPYVVKRNNVVESCLTEVAAIGLINTYCSTLLKAKFVCLVPVWILYEESSEMNLFKVSLKLPNISPLKTEIYSDVMKSRDGAKRSAAMKTCIKLHELGALNDKLLPATNDETTQNLNLNLFPNWIDEDNYQTGTYKKKRDHELKYPNAFYGAYPQPLQPLYLHILNCTSMYSVSSYNNRRTVFHNLLNDKNGFGILSTKRLPKIPSFPIFMKDGKLNVDVKSNHNIIKLSGNDIEKLKRFHFLLFNDIISLIKKFMIFDNDNLENSFLIVPLNDVQEINWSVLETYQSLERIMPCKPFHFKTTDYELALVSPTYRGSTVYVVTRVCDDLTPESCFPNEDFDTFTHYYKEKHGLIVENLQQSMLEVKLIPTKINYIKPRKLPEGPLKYKKTDDTLEDLQEHLIPELCWRINFPTVYWLKATTLPSILHRICQFLIAEDLRVTIAKESKLGLLTLKKLSPLEIEDIDQLNEEDYNNALEMTDDSIEKTQKLDQIYSDLNMFELDCNPFLRDQEPRDLYRDIEKIQMIDIQYYNQFMSINCNEDENVKKNVNKSVGCYMERSTVSVPSLNVLAFSNGQSSSQGPNTIDIMHALTTKLGQDMFNLERLETLGDSYLKFIVSLFLYHTFPMFNEGQLTALKGKIIGNRNLYYCGNKKDIPGRIKNDAFVPMSNFIPPAFTVLHTLQQILLAESIAPNILYCPAFEISEQERFTGYINEETKNSMLETVINCDKGDKQTGIEHYLGIQILSDKTVADSVEALIGVYLRSNGIKGAAELLKWFGILPDIKIDELLDNNSPDPVIGNGDPNHHMPWADTIETKFGYKFKNRAFLLQAFTHPSYTPNGITECYQRLEFLGDAILDFLITCYIYENCGKLSPGELTDLRSALVNNITFACLAVRYGLHTALLAYAPKLHEIIDRFVKFQEERDYVVNDELLYVLIEEDECNLIEYVDVPKVLGDLFESLIGAIYLDSGKNLTKVWEMIYSLMHKEIDEFSKNVPKQPVRVIHENTDIHPKFLDATLIEGTGMIMIPLKITIAGKEKLFHGFGVNKKQAKCAAAKQALKRLQLEK